MIVELMAVQHRGSTWTAEEDRRLLDLIAAGKSWTLISGTLRRSMKSVKLHAKRGLKKNESGETARARRNDD
jgi:DNA-binding NarL/FixJ family response regulator